MPRIETLSPGHYKYLCECGREVMLETDGETERPQRLSRCWECSEKHAYRKEDLI